MRIVMRVIPVVLLAAVSYPVGAQTKTIDVCNMGDTKVYTGVVPGSGGKMSSGNELRSLAALCTPKSPDFVGEDSKALLTKIKFAKLQNDSSKKLTSAFAARQKAIGDERMITIREARTTSGAQPEPTSDAEARRLYLTPEMQGLRERLLLSLRALMTPEQIPQFEANVAALKAKDAKGVKGVR